MSAVETPPPVQLGEWEKKVVELYDYAYDDFYLFAKYVFGLDIVPDTHRAVCDEMQEHHKRGEDFIVEIPRRCFKTHMGCAFVAWLVMHNPNIRVCISSENFKNASTIVKILAPRFESGQLDYYSPEGTPWYNPRDKGKKWTQTELEVGPRTLIDRSPTVLVSSIGTVRTGLGFDFYLLDDLNSEYNTATPTQLDVVNLYAENLFLTAEPGARKMILATPYNYGDLAWKMEQQGWPVYRRGAINDDGTAFFPKDAKDRPRLTLEEIEAKRKTLRPSIFYAQILCTLRSDEELMISRDYFRYLDVTKIQELKRQQAIFIAVDPAGWKDKPRASWTAFVVVGVDKEAKLHVYEAFHARPDPRKIQEILWSLCVKWKPHYLIIETINYQESIEFYFKERMAKENKWFVIRPVKPGSDLRKDQRIEGLVAPYANERVLHVPGLIDLEEELTRWPKWDQKDIADALAWVPLVCFKGGVNLAARIPDDENDPAQLRELVRAEVSGKKIGGMEFPREEAQEELAVVGEW